MRSRDRIFEDIITIIKEPERTLYRQVFLSKNGKHILSQLRPYR